MTGLVCLVTGSAGGVGQATAQALAADGHVVYATMRDPAGRHAAAARMLARDCTVAELDVTRDDSVVAAVADITGATGRLDVVVNCAGTVLLGPLEDLAVDSVREQFDTNVFGALRVMRAVAPVMRRGRSGIIVQISSISGVIVTPCAGAYQASKWALEAACEAYAYELGHFGVRVHLVQPGDLAGSAGEAPRPGSDFTPLTDQVLGHARRGATPGGDAGTVAQVIAGIVRAPRPHPLRVPVGTDVKLARQLRTQLSEDDYRKAIWDLYALDW